MVQNKQKKENTENVEKKKKTECANTKRHKETAVQLAESNKTLEQFEQTIQMLCFVKLLIEYY